MSQINRVILAQCVSTSGLYKLFLCEHMVGGRFCFDVATQHQVTKNVVARHYRKDISDTLNKAEALRVYDQFREKLTAAAGPQEEDNTAKMIIIEPN